MIDPTHCRLTVPTEFYKQSELWLDELQIFDECKNINNGLTEFTFHELDPENPILSKLLKAGIPHNWEYESTAQLDAAGESLRFTSIGVPIYASIYDGYSSETLLDEIMTLCNTSTMSQIRKKIYREMSRYYVIDLHDPDQIIYGKRYILNKLTGGLPANRFSGFNTTPRYMIPKDVRRDWLTTGLKT